MNNIRTRFRAPWDLLLILMTGGFFAFLVGLGIALGSLTVVVINWSIIFICIAFGIYGYSIQEGELQIVRLGWSKRIVLRDIKRVEDKPMAMMGSIRIFGIGGVFGYIGNFRNSNLGRYKAYVTNRQKTVLITIVDDIQILVSPDDPKAFVSSLQREVNSASK